MDLFFKLASRVIDNLISAELAEEFQVVCGRRSDDMCPVQFGELHGDNTDTTCRTVNQDALPCREFGCLNERGPGCNRCVRNRSRLNMVQQFWLGNDEISVYSYIFSICASNARVGPRKYFIAYCKLCNTNA